MQREDVLGQALQLLEIQGIASTTLEMVADRIDYPLDELRRFWPDKEALLYDALRYLSQQVDIWRRQLMLNEELTTEQKLLARYTALTECVTNNRYPRLSVYRRLHLLSGSSGTPSINWQISKNEPRTSSHMSC